MKSKKKMTKGDTALIAILQAIAVFAFVTIVIKITAGMVGCTAASEATVPPVDVQAQEASETDAKVINYMMDDAGRLIVVTPAVIIEAVELEEDASDADCEEYDEDVVEDEDEYYDDIIGC